MANPHLALAMPPEVEALVREAQAEERTGGFDAARERYEAALRLLAGHDAAPAFASSLVRWIGRSHRAEGDGDAAMDCYIASLAIAELQGDRTNIAHALNSMGILDRDRGRLDRALERFDAARRIAEAEGDLRLVAMVEQNMGVIANIQGDLPRARSHYRRSLEGYRAAGEEAFLGSLLNNLGMLHTDLGEWEEAEQVLGEAAAHCERMGNAATWVRVEINRAELCVHTAGMSRALGNTVTRPSSWRNPSASAPPCPRSTSGTASFSGRPGSSTWPRRTSGRRVTSPSASSIRCSRPR